MSLSRSSGQPVWKIVAAFVAVYLIWGSSYLAIRFTLEGFPPFFVPGVRFLIAGVILLALARRTGAPAPTRANWRAALILGFIMFFIGNGALMWAETRLDSGVASMLYATTPFWFVLLGWLWLGEERPTRRVVFSLMTGFAGIILLIGPGKAAGGLDLIGVALCLISALSWAIGSTLTRRLPVPSSAMMGAALNLLTGGAMLLLASVLTGELATFNPADVTPRALASVGYLIIGPSIIAYTSYTYLLNTVASSQLSTYAYVNPVVAMFLGWAIGGEALTSRALVASVIIITAVVLITRRRRRGTGETAAYPVAADPGFRSRLRALAGRGAR